MGFLSGEGKSNVRRKETMQRSMYYEMVDAMRKLEEEAKAEELMNG